MNFKQNLGSLVILMVVIHLKGVDGKVYNSLIMKQALEIKQQQMKICVFPLSEKTEEDQLTIQLMVTSTFNHKNTFLAAEALIKGLQHNVHNKLEFKHDEKNSIHGLIVMLNDQPIQLKDTKRRWISSYRFSEMILFSKGSVDITDCPSSAESETSTVDGITTQTSTVAADETGIYASADRPVVTMVELAPELLTVEPSTEENDTSSCKCVCDLISEQATNTSAVPVKLTTTEPTEDTTVEREEEVLEELQTKVSANPENGTLIKKERVATNSTRNEDDADYKIQLEEVEICIQPSGGDSRQSQIAILLMVRSTMKHENISTVDSLPEDFSSPKYNLRTLQITKCQSSLQLLSPVEPSSQLSSVQDLSPQSISKTTDATTFIEKRTFATSFVRKRTFATNFAKNRIVAPTLNTTTTCRNQRIVIDGFKRYISK